MTTGEKPQDEFDITAALVSSGMGSGPVINSRRLVRVNPETEGRIAEVYSFVTASRILAMPNNSADSQTHTELRRIGLPVLPRYEGGTENLDLLVVPAGTWSLGSRLHLVRRDIVTYSNLFSQVVQSQRQQYERGLGVIAPSEELRTVDHFAFTPNLQTPSGQQLFLVPPYNIDQQGTPETFAEHFITELAASGEFNSQQLDYLQKTIMWEARGNAD